CATNAGGIAEALYWYFDIW
nr:immunoglobulin heavy chain junction region [Macaca mulatta]